MAAIIGLSLLFQWFGITAIQATTYAQVLSIALLFLLVGRKAGPSLPDLRARHSGLSDPCRLYFHRGGLLGTAVQATRCSAGWWAGALPWI